MAGNLSATFMMSTLPPKTGGEIYDDHLYRHALAQGWRLEYIPVEKLREETRDRVVQRFGWLPSQLISLLTAVALVRRLGRLRGLLVQDQEYSVALLGANLLLRMFRRGRIVTIVHHVPSYDSTAPESREKRFLRWKNKVALSLSARLLTVSAYSKQELISMGIKADRISILFPGMDRSGLEIFPRPESDERINVITLGNVSPRKGIIYLVEAFKEVASSRPKLHLHLVGSTTMDGDYYKQVRGLLTSAAPGVADRVYFHGRLPQNEVNRLLSEADIFAMPSLQEGFGIALLEAMHYGLPIITTNITALPELVEEGVNGFLVPPADAPALGAALQRLADDPGLRRQLGEGGRRRVDGRFHWEDTCRQFEEEMWALSRPRA